MPLLLVLVYSFNAASKKDYVSIDSTKTPINFIGSKSCLNNTLISKILTTNNQ